MEENVIEVSSILHPYYMMRQTSWYKWRLTFESGELYLQSYLKKFSKSEDENDYQRRKAMTPIPAFAKAAVIEVRNSIYQRLADIAREGGSASWLKAIKGEIGGVDLLGSSMNTFMGTEVLEELLVMGKVGVYIDMPPKQGSTIAENIGIRPYLYVYRAEDIRCWDDDESPTPNAFRAVLLRDTVFTRDKNFGLPNGTEHRYRYYWRDDNGDVWVKFYNAKSKQIDLTNAESDQAIKLDIKRIPFVVLELNNSLLADIANHQIALLNLGSADVAYAFGANFAFYTEQYDPRAVPSHLKGAVEVATDTTTGNVTISNSATPPGEAQDIQVGPTSGRRYAKDLDRPDFIHPSSEPIKASMEKQEQLKLDIRLLINLSIANIQLKMASAESKGMDVRTAESGLSYIGLIMEDGERQIADVWHEYENQTSVNRTVKYPEKYSLRNDKEIFAEVDELKKQMSSTMSLTYKRTLAKRIAELLIGHRVTNDDMQKVFDEIDKADVVEVFVEKIEKDVEGGYLSHELAAKLRGYPEGDVKKAQEEQVKRLELIAMSQAKGGGTGAANEPQGNLKNPGARGVADISPTPGQDVKAEKDAAGNPVRGKA